MNFPIVEKLIHFIFFFLVSTFFLERFGHADYLQHVLFHFVLCHFFFLWLSGVGAYLNLPPQSRWMLNRFIQSAAVLPIFYAASLHPDWLPWRLFLGIGFILAGEHHRARFLSGEGAFYQEAAREFLPLTLPFSLIAGFAPHFSLPEIMQWYALLYVSAMFYTEGRPWSLLPCLLGLLPMRAALPFYGVLIYFFLGSFRLLTHKRPFSLPYIVYFSIFSSGVAAIFDLHYLAFFLFSIFAYYPYNMFLFLLMTRMELLVNFTSPMEFLPLVLFFHQEWAVEKSPPHSLHIGLLLNWLHPGTRPFSTLAMLSLFKLKLRPEFLGQWLFLFYLFFLQITQYHFLGILPPE